MDANFSAKVVQSIKSLSKNQKEVVRKIIRKIQKHFIGLATLEIEKFQIQNKEHFYYEEKKYAFVFRVENKIMIIDIFNIK